ncbi:hypothetical protein DQ04_00331100 [Trypanosoma grayi]|uniref:hypothetical protein n=1 Tax=Trypanosoma grayi TaxID=71804 RepID=UPI0004F4148F|nr:hypothetical protein DQ04_00331100 [Trypanosoma grayi]KEG14717.1 hypothetical protein DQ04_00331100 [Trypanosoma grayi]
MPNRVLLVTFCLFFLGLALVAEANIHLRVAHDTRRVIYLGTFAFGPQGAARLQTREFSVPQEMIEYYGNVSVLAANTLLGFMLEPTDSVSLARAYEQYGRGDIGPPLLSGSATSKSDVERTCFIKDPLVAPGQRSGRVIFPFSGLSVKDILAAPMTQAIYDIGLYAVYFYNCADMPTDGRPVKLKTLPKRPISFNVDFELYWVNGEKGLVHLSYGDRGLPGMYAVFGVAFAVMGALWMSQIVRQWTHVKKIHLLMLLLVLVKTATLFIEGMKLNQYAKTGKASVWDYFFYATVTLKGAMLFGVIMLLGAGWSLIREYLSDIDKLVLLAVLPSQVLLNVCLAIIEETSEGNRNWSTWFDILQILDVVCCCCVLFPLVWSIKKLREASETDESTARTITRMREFRSFYIAIVAYIYFTRIVLIMVANALSYDKAWIAKAGAEIVAVLFYTYCGFRFRPGASVSHYEVLQRVDVVSEAEMREYEGGGKKNQELVQ